MHKVKRDGNVCKYAPKHMCVPIHIHIDLIVFTNLLGNNDISMAMRTPKRSDFGF